MIQLTLNIFSKNYIVINIENSKFHKINALFLIYKKEFSNNKEAKERGFNGFLDFFKEVQYLSIFSDKNNTIFSNSSIILDYKMEKNKINENDSLINVTDFLTFFNQIIGE